MSHPVFKLIGYIEEDMRGIHAKLTELRAHLADMHLEDVELPVCPVCGPLHLPPSTTLADHMWNLHDQEAA